MQIVTKVLLATDTYFDKVDFVIQTVGWDSQPQSLQSFDVMLKLVSQMCSGVL